MRGKVHAPNFCSYLYNRGDLGEITIQNGRQNHYGNFSFEQKKSALLVVNLDPAVIGPNNNNNK